MKLAILDINDSCTGCGACVSVCPRECLKLSTDEYGFYYPEYDSSLCIECGLCEKVCHVNKPVEKKANNCGFHYYISKDEAVVEKSSSGGAFSAFAEYVLSKGGVVFGSYYNGDERRLEVASSDNVDWKLFRKSKYVESYMGDTCNQITHNLTDGRDVLFCGTPCEVRGVRNYLNIKRICQDKLLLLDFVCHGVPTNRVFNAFLTKYGLDKPIRNVDFRYKDFSTKSCGWHDLVMNVSYMDGTQQLIPYYPPYSFYYLNIFSNDRAHRLSCLHCNHIDYSMADVTIGDFWGIDKMDTKLDTNKGISLVKIHNDKADVVWQTIKKNGTTDVIGSKYAEYIYNKKDRMGNLISRNNFLKLFEQKGLNTAVYKSNKKSVIDYYTVFQVKRLIKLFLRKNFPNDKIRIIKAK